MAPEVTLQDESGLIFKESCFQGGKDEHCVFVFVFVLLLPYLPFTVVLSLNHPQTLTLP